MYAQMVEWEMCGSNRYRETGEDSRAIPPNASTSESGATHERGTRSQEIDKGNLRPDGGMVDTEVSKSSAFELAGSSPALGTT